MLRNLVSAALGVSAALTLGASAFAGPQTPGPNDGVEIVRATSAELQSPDGARRVAFRVRVAADRACGGDVYPLYVRASTGFQTCREEAVDRAAEQVNAPLLSRALGLPSQTIASNDR